MCGIAGCYQQTDGLQLTTTMNELLAHRGPDGSGLYSLVDGRVAAHLAHRRLSIIDLSDAAAQPFCSDGLALVYNGELYNYRELRAELAAAGVTFRSTSDTEVVLQAWRRWGPGALDRFRGMFAFAVLDEATGHLFLARDHLGIKPLFVRRRGRGVVFASELKALMGAIGSELEMEPGALVASMLYYWVPEQRCVIKDVDKLPAGSWLEVRPDGTSQLRYYWRLADVAAEAAAAGPTTDLGAVVEASVAAHLVADVPVSTLLSGGLDSSIVTVLAKRADANIDAYTIAFRPEDQRLEATPDDAHFARRVASRYGVELHEIEIAPDIVDLLPRMVASLDEPIGDAAAINTFLICRTAREAGVKVLLSGMGADEMFGGYRKHYACLLAARYRRLPPRLRHTVVPAVDRLPVTVRGRGLKHVRWAKRFLSFAEMAEEPGFRRSYTLFAGDELVSLVDANLAPVVGELFAEHAAIYNDSVLADQVSRMCLADARLFLPGLNLAYTDRSSMAASTEVRVPFVDVEVFKAAFSLPGSAKIKGRTAKAALKEAAAAWLPPEIIRRPKGSFSAPLRAWVGRDLAEMVDELVLGGSLVGSGFLRRQAVERLMEDDRTGREDRSKQIWQLLNLELWCRQARALGVKG